MTEKYVPPLVQVLPITNKTSHILESDVNKTKYPDGMLAWGNMETAIQFGCKFHVVIITAEEFPFTDSRFMKWFALSKLDVYHVPISEVSRGSVVKEQNMIHQPVKRAVVGIEPGTVQFLIDNPSVTSDLLIYENLLKKKLVLVVCIAGKNRSTSTLLRFLMLHSLRQENNKETSLLQKARKTSWDKKSWEQYLYKKRKFEIFPLNDIQLVNLDETLRSLRTKPVTKKTSNSTATTTKKVST